MDSTCKLADHFNKPYTWVCTNPNCQNKHILCSKCLTVLHRNCLNFMLHIEDIFKNNFTDNSNWIQNKEIKDAILTVEKYGLTGSISQLAKAFEELVEKEFNEVSVFFNTKLNETKEKVLKVFQESVSTENLKVEEFSRQVNNMYNFDRLSAILKPLRAGEKEPNQVNQELDDFLRQVNSMKTQEQELLKLSKNLNSFVQNYLEIDRSLFQSFKEAIPFSMLNKYSPTREAWTWSPVQKSSKIVLTDGNTKAKRVDPSYTYAAVIGTMKMSKGHYQWELEVASGNPQHQWITFGVLEANLVKNLDNFAYTETHGMSTYGQYYKMNKVGTMSDLDNKTFLCDLNLAKGTFTISCQGVVICKEQSDLKDKTFLPFAILYRNSNSIAIKFVK